MNNERVEKLEKQIRTQQKLNWLLGIALFGMVGFGFTPPMLEHITARSLCIIDENGMPRIILSSEPGKSEPKASIRHLDAKGNPKLWQGTEGDIISSTYYDNDGMMRQSNGVDGKRNGTWYSFFDQEKVNAEMSWTFGGEEFPQIVLGHGQIFGVEKILMFNPEMEIRIAIDANHEGDPSLQMLDENAVSRVVLGTYSEGPSGVSVYDEVQELRWSACTEELRSGVSHYDKNGKNRCSIAILEDSNTFFSINNKDEDFDILMGSLDDHFLFSIEGEQEENLQTSLPSTTTQHALENE
jgi:hypothetical protein